MLNQNRLKELLIYDKDTGLFFSNISNSVVGYKDDDGYIRIKINKKYYRAHRLAFLYMTGKFPDRQVDHKDLDKSNNKWDNIRSADNSKNNMNRILQKNNSSGYRGVSQFKGRYRAIINKNKESIFLGYFETAEQASYAYKRAAIAKFGEFYRETRI